MCVSVFVSVCVCVHERVCVTVFMCNYRSMHTLSSVSLAQWQARPADCLNIIMYYTLWLAVVLNSDPAAQIRPGEDRVPAAQDNNY